MADGDVLHSNPNQGVSAVWNGKHWKKDFNPFPLFFLFRVKDTLSFGV
jgi:hypothetical protein